MMKHNSIVADHTQFSRKRIQYSKNSTPDPNTQSITNMQRDISNNTEYDVTSCYLNDDSSNNDGTLLDLKNERDELKRGVDC